MSGEMKAIAKVAFWTAMGLWWLISFAEWTSR